MRFVGENFVISCTDAIHLKPIRTASPRFIIIISTQTHVVGLTRFAHIQSNPINEPVMGRRQMHSICNEEEDPPGSALGLA